MVEVFKTNISTKKMAKQVIIFLKELFPVAKINFDLEDCDKILRIETVDDLIDDKLVIQLMKQQGFYMETLPDHTNIQN